MIANPHTSNITISLNGLNSLIKSYIESGWIRKQNPNLCCLQETHLSSKDEERFKINCWKTNLQENGTKGKIGAMMVLSDKINFH